MLAARANHLGIFESLPSRHRSHQPPPGPQDAVDLRQRRIPNVVAEVLEDLRHDHSVKIIVWERHCLAVTDVCSLP